MIHLEQFAVYLALWKDLNKDKRKQQRNKILLLKLEGWSSACFFLPQLSALTLSYCWHTAATNSILLLLSLGHKQSQQYTWERTHVPKGAKAIFRF